MTVRIFSLKISALSQTKAIAMNARQDAIVAKVYVTNDSIDNRLIPININPSSKTFSILMIHEGTAYVPKGLNIVLWHFKEYMGYFEAVCMHISNH